MEEEKGSSIFWYAAAIGVLLTAVVVTVLIVSIIVWVLNSGDDAHAADTAPIPEEIETTPEATPEAYILEIVA